MSVQDPKERRGNQIPDSFASKAAEPNPPGQKNRLGRGLASLLGEMHRDSPAETSEASQLRQLPLSSVQRSISNPRKDFSREEIDDLADSIRKNGVIQPLLVRPAAVQGQFEIVVGERRWRAAKQAGLQTVPAVICSMDDEKALALAIVENVQRADLNPLEEAAGYQQLLTRFGYTQEQLAQAVGKSRSYVTNMMRLLKLPDSVQEYVRTRQLSTGHARALINSEAPERLAQILIEKEMSVREAEELVAAHRKTRNPEKATKRTEPNPDTQALEELLTRSLGTQVKICHRGGGAGYLRIDYHSVDQLGLVCKQLHPPLAKAPS